MYRFLIKQNQKLPEHKVFPQLGIFIDLDKSNETHVFLTKTDLNTEGTFSCEVSTDAPSFKTVKAEKDLRIYVSSTEDLRIVGITHNSYYSPGDFVNLTCLSGPTKPPTILSWFINRKQVTKHFGLPVNISKQLIDLTPNGLTSTSLNIVFQISGRFFQAKTGTIELACESILTTVYGITFEEYVVEQQSSTNNQHSAYTSLREGELDYNFQGEDYIGPEYLEMPLSPPRIQQESGSFLIGSRLDLNCTSALSYPPIYLQWLVNNREAELGAESIAYSANEPSNELTGLVYDKFAVFNIPRLKPLKTTLGLRLQMDKELYQTNDGYLRLRCVATHAKLVSRKRTELLLFGKPRHPSRLFAYSSGSNKVSTNAFWLAIILPGFCLVNLFLALRSR